MHTPSVFSRTVKFALAALFGTTLALPVRAADPYVWNLDGTEKDCSSSDFFKKGDNLVLSNGTWQVKSSGEIANLSYGSNFLPQFTIANDALLWADSIRILCSDSSKTGTMTMTVEKGGKIQLGGVNCYVNDGRKSQTDQLIIDGGEVWGNTPNFSIANPGQGGMSTEKIYGVLEIKNGGSLNIPKGTLGVSVKADSVSSAVSGKACGTLMVDGSNGGAKLVAKKIYVNPKATDTKASNYQKNCHTYASSTITLRNCEIEIGDLYAYKYGAIAMTLDGATISTMSGITDTSFFTLNDKADDNETCVLGDGGVTFNIKDNYGAGAKLKFGFPASGTGFFKKTGPYDMTFSSTYTQTYTGATICEEGTLFIPTTIASTDLRAVGGTIDLTGATLPSADKIDLTLAGAGGKFVELNETATYKRITLGEGAVWELTIDENGAVSEPLKASTWVLAATAENPISLKISGTIPEGTQIALPSHFTVADVDKLHLASEGLELALDGDNNLVIQTAREVGEVVWNGAAGESWWGFSKWLLDGTSQQTTFLPGDKAKFVDDAEVTGSTPVSTPLIDVAAEKTAQVSTPISSAFTKIGAGTLVLKNGLEGALTLNEGCVAFEGVEKNPLLTTQDANAIAGTLDLGGAEQTILVETPDNVFKSGFKLVNGTLTANFPTWWHFNGGRTVTIGPDAILNTGIATPSKRDGSKREGELNIRQGSVVIVDGGTLNANNDRTEAGNGNNIGNDWKDGADNTATLRVINGGTFNSTSNFVELAVKDGTTGTLSVSNGTVNIANGGKWLSVAPGRSTKNGTPMGIVAMTNGTLIAQTIVLCDASAGSTAKLTFKDSEITTQRIYKNKNPSSSSFVKFDGATINTAADEKDVLSALNVDYTLEGKGVTINATNQNTTVGGSFAGTAPFVKKGAETLTFNGSFKKAATFQVDEGVLALGSKFNQNFAKTGEGTLLVSVANEKNVTGIKGVLDLGGNRQTGTTANGSGFFGDNGVVSNGTLDVTFTGSWCNLANTTFTIAKDAHVYTSPNNKTEDSGDKAGELNLQENAKLIIDGGEYHNRNHRKSWGHYIGCDSATTAEVEVKNGGLFHSYYRFLSVGRSQGATGILTVDGGTVNLADGAEELRIANSESGDDISIKTSTGIVNVTNGGLIQAKAIRFGSVTNGNGADGSTAQMLVQDSTIEAQRFYTDKSLSNTSYLTFDGATWEVTGSETAIMSDLKMPITIGEGGLTIDTDHDVTISAVLFGPGKITKKGTGTLTIQGAQQFTGGIEFAEDEESVGKVILAGGASLPMGAMSEADIQKLATPIWYKLQVNPDTQRLEVVDAPETTWLGEDDGFWSEGTNWSVGAPPVEKSVTIFEATETKDHGTTVYDLTNNKIPIPSEIDVNSGAWTTKVDQASFSDAKLKIAEGAEFALDGASGKTNPFATTGNEIQGTLDLGEATQNFEGTSSIKKGSVLKNGKVNMSFTGWMTLNNNFSFTIGKDAVVNTSPSGDNTYGELNVKGGSVLTIDGGTFSANNARAKNGNNIGNDSGTGTMRIVNGGKFESPNIRVQVGAHTSKGETKSAVGTLSVDNGEVILGGESGGQSLIVGGSRADQEGVATGIVAMTNGTLTAWSIQLGADTNNKNGKDGNTAQLTFKDSDLKIRNIYKAKGITSNSYFIFDGTTIFPAVASTGLLQDLGIPYQLRGDGLTIDTEFDVASAGTLDFEAPLVKKGSGTLTVGGTLQSDGDIDFRILGGTLAFQSGVSVKTAQLCIALEGPDSKVSGLSAKATTFFKRLTLGEGSNIDQSFEDTGNTIRFKEIEVPEGVTANVATAIGADFAKTGLGTLVLTNCACGKALDLKEGEVALAWSDTLGTNPFSTAQDANVLAGTLDLGGAEQKILVATPDNVFKDGFKLMNGTLNANFTGWWSMGGGKTLTIGPCAILNTGVGTANGRDKYNREGELNIRQGSALIVDGGTLNANNDRNDAGNGNNIGNDWKDGADNTATLRVINGGAFNSTTNFVEIGVKQGVTGILAVTNGTVNIADGNKWLSVAPGREGNAPTGIVAMKDGVLSAQTIVLCDASAGGTAQFTFKDSEISTQRIYKKNTPSQDSYLIFDGATWKVTGARADILTDLGCTITIGVGGLTIDTDHDVTISAILSGPGKLVKKGTGVLTLEGAQEFTGGIEFAEGAERTVALTETTTIAGGITEENFENFIVPEGMMLFVRSDGSIGVRKDGASVWKGGASNDAWSQSGNWDGGVPNNSTAIFSGPGKTEHTTYDLGSTAITNITVESGDWTTDVGSKCFTNVPIDLRSGASFALENAASRTNPFSPSANANTIAGTLDLGGATQTFAGDFTKDTGIFSDGGEIRNVNLTLDPTGWIRLPNVTFTIGTDAKVTVKEFTGSAGTGELNLYNNSYLKIDGGSLEISNKRNVTNTGAYIGNNGDATIEVLNGSFTHIHKPIFLGYGGDGKGAGDLLGDHATVDLGEQTIYLGNKNGSASCLALTNSTLTCNYLQFGFDGTPGKQTIDLKNTTVKFSGFGAQKVNNNSKVKLDGVTFIDKGDHITLFPDTMPTCELGPDGILVQAKRGSDHSSISINSRFTGEGGMTIETPDSDFSVSLGGTPDFMGDFVFKGPGKLALSEGMAFHGNVILTNGAGFRDYDPIGDQEIDEAKAVLTTTGTITFDQIGQKLPGKRNRFFTKTKDGVTTLYFGPKPTGIIFFIGQN